MVDRRHIMADALNNKRQQPKRENINARETSGYDLLESGYTQQ